MQRPLSQALGIYNVAPLPRTFYPTACLSTKLRLQATWKNNLITNLFRDNNLKCVRGLRHRLRFHYHLRSCVNPMIGVSHFFTNGKEATDQILKPQLAVPR